MQITFLSVLTIIVFIAQFTLCIKKAKLVIRLIPVILLLVGLAVCGIVYFAAQNIYGAAFAAAVCAGVLVILLAVDGAAWFAALLIPNKK